MKDNHKLADKYNPKEFEEKLYEEGASWIGIQNGINLHWESS